MSLWEQIAIDISRSTGTPFEVGDRRAVGGGCISAAYALTGKDGRAFFVKTNSADGLDMFEAEAQGLSEMANTSSITVPRPHGWGIADAQSYLVMDYLNLRGAGNARDLGEQLAALHRHTARAFGWHRDNTIGATPQPNDWDTDWIRFWTHHRLGFQLQLAARNGYGGRLQDKGERLLEGFAGLFVDYRPEPSLLHGDLWSGNYGFDDAGQPVIFDPATYYGDREADLAMTELFGGFGRDFYAAYEDAWPLDAGYAVRKTLYNLYHILNHLNLFGSGYRSQAEGMMDRLLSEL
ncbi:MAG: fructosamine kinase family protein [Gammaproteobacteria bacterium]|nr:fructosamine kinase family protein [Gammaproteobacteria bacterium]